MAVHRDARPVRHLDERARPSDAVVGTIGINTHLGYTDTTYGPMAGRVAPLLKRLGVRYVRDGALTGAGYDADSNYYRRLRAISAQGIRFDLVTNTETNNGPGTDLSKLADVDAWTGDAVTAFEGPNEPDLRAGPKWVAKTTKLQHALRATVRNTGSLAGVKVIAPSVVSAQDAARLGPLTGAAQYGNLHNYFSDRQPETTGWGDDGYGSVRWNLHHIADRILPRTPAMSTETGYFTAPVTSYGLPEKIAAYYTPRIILTHFLDGVSRTYLYELLDEGANRHEREDNFGLVRANGTLKPAYVALRTMIHLLADPGPSFRPSRLSYGLRGAGPSVHHLLLQKRTGQFVLALWLDGASWDPEGNKQLHPRSRSVTVQLPQGRSVDAITRLVAHGAPVAVRPHRQTMSIPVGPAVTFLTIGPSKK